MFTRRTWSLSRWRVLIVITSSCETGIAMFTWELNFTDTFQFSWNSLTKVQVLLNDKDNDKCFWEAVSVTIVPSCRERRILGYWFNQGPRYSLGGRRRRQLHSDLLAFWRIEIMTYWLSVILMTFWTTLILIPKLKRCILTYWHTDILTCGHNVFWHPVDILNNFCFDN